MSTKPRPKPSKAFLTVTLFTVMAVATVFTVYAAFLMTMYGTPVTVNQAGGSVQYNLSDTSNSSWTNSLSPFNNGTAWYARANVTNAAPQAVTIIWTLQSYTGTSWTAVSSPVTTTITLSAGLNTIYATTTGSFIGNFNWGSLTTTGGSYRVEVTVNG